MQFIFADDSEQRKPYRDGMRHFDALGGVFVSHERLSSLESALESICSNHGFPPKEEFKWSPDSSQWMHQNLKDDDRKAFFTDVLRAGAEQSVRALVVIVDRLANRASKKAKTVEHDATIMFLERVGLRLEDLKEDGVVVVDHPGSKKERPYLALCKELLVNGSEYVQPLVSR